MSCLDTVRNVPPLVLHTLLIMTNRPAAFQPYLPTGPFVRLFIRSFVRPSVCLFIRLFARQSLFCH